jgi:hypothetical protein
MSSTNFPLRLPADLKEAATRQAENAGMSLNQYMALAIAGRVGAVAEAERYFKARAKRTKPGRAKEILRRLGTQATPRRGDRMADEDE